MAYSKNTFSVGQVLTAAEMNQIEENIEVTRLFHKGSTTPAGLAAGVNWIDDTSSPWTWKVYDGTDWISIGTIDPTGNAFEASGLASGAVHRSELSIGTETESTTSTTTPVSRQLNNADGYGFLPILNFARWNVAGVGGDVLLENAAVFGNETFYMEATTGTGTISFYYVNSSPPYDFGEGLVGKFVYAEIRPSGEIVGTWSADDPPWSKEIVKGRQRIDRDTGKAWVLLPKKRSPARWGQCTPEEKESYIDILKGEPEFEWVELTNEMKMRGKEKAPSPFPGISEENNTIVILDPPSDIWHRIGEMMKIDRELCIACLLHDGYLRIGDAINREGPPGIPVHSVRWR